MEDRRLTLRDGREIAYCVAGPADGLPVFLFHGIAESRFMVSPDAASLERLGIRLIAVDRPGVGGSSYRRRRTILSWADDVAALGDHLECRTFAVLGRSAGVPYALACAYALPERVTAATVVSGVGPPTLDVAKAVFGTQFWKLALGLRFAPLVMRAGLWLTFHAAGWYVRPRLGRFLDRHVAHLPEADRATLANPELRDVRLRSMTESFSSGPRGLYQDLSLLVRRWGFNPADIRVPVRLWHGEADNIVSVAFGRLLASRLPDCEAHFLPDLGHYLLFSHWDQILATAKADTLRHLNLSRSTPSL